jgi:hypothetical protein
VKRVKRVKRDKRDKRDKRVTEPGVSQGRIVSTTGRRRACPVARAVVGQVEPNLGLPITRANLWLVQAPEQTEQYVWDVIVIAAIAALETGRRFRAATLGASPAWMREWNSMAERGARRAVMNSWGRLQRFTQLGVSKRGLASQFQGYRNRNGYEMLGIVV